MAIDTDILTWLKSLNGWQCELAYRILSNGQVSDKDYSEIDRCLKITNHLKKKHFLKLA